MVIRYVADQVNAFLNQEYGTNRDYVIMIDTDSNYLTLSTVVQNIPQKDRVDFLDNYCEKTLQPIIDKAFQHIRKVLNTQTGILAMKRESIAEYGVCTGKKRYLLLVHDVEGVRYDTPKLKVTGIETVRSSSPKHAKVILKQALELFVRQNKAAFYDLLEQAEQDYHKLPFTDIASPRTCSGMKDYPMENNGTFASKTPIQVRGSFVYNRHLEETGLTQKYPKIRDGDKIRFCYLLPQNPLRNNVIAAPNDLPKEWGLEKFLDRNEQFEKTIIAPLERIVTFAGWTVRPIVTLDF